jgi:magnesium-protoporphyrin IX monomethyl ester (oxidative) cyclase
MLDVLLIATPLIMGDHRLDFKPPLNLLFLHSYLKQQGLASDICDMVSERSELTDVLARIKRQKPKTIGIPLYHATTDTVFELIRAIRQMDPTIKIIGGGPSFTIEPDKYMQSGLLDAGVIGEGEVTFLETIKAVQQDDPPHTPGAAFKKGDQVVIHPRRPQIENLDELPFLDYSPINMEVYFDYQKRMGIEKTIFMTTSRGCAFRCTFCSTPLLWGPSNVRRVSAGRILAEIESLTKQFPGVNIGFLDDSFFADRKWLAEFLPGIKKLGVKYTCIGRVDHLDTTLIEQTAESGCTYVAFGVETGSQLRQRQIKKYLSLDKLKRNMAAFSKYDITTKCFFMLGFPDETIEEMADTINLAVDLAIIGMRKCSFFPVIVYPGTEMARAFDFDEFDAGIYEDYVIDMAGYTGGAAPVNAGDTGMSMYSTVPKSDSNPYLNHKALVKLIKIAYQKVTDKEHITVAEIEDLRDPDWTPRLTPMSSTQLATPITTAEMVMPALRPD